MPESTKAQQVVVTLRTMGMECKYPLEIVENMLLWTKAQHGGELPEELQDMDPEELRYYWYYDWPHRSTETISITRFGDTARQA